ncbi:MAG: N-methylhydantoinase A [Ktedonobacterales bacterium]|jgi:S-adenosylmethionine hydrolase|nr:MAG: N-methylhydantoinase A [Ktedonobacterales bacterium]
MSSTVAAPLVALLTDFGIADGYPGVLKGVILGIAPSARLVDLTHEIPPQDVLAGAWVLHTAWRSFPEDTIFLCVVDPGVGSARRPLALRAGGRWFIGPDNGLFSYVLAAASPGAAVALDDPRYHLPNPSATFHGRDIFAPCAAHLGAGVPLAALGSPLDLASLVVLALARPTWHAGTLSGQIAHVDRFGNLLTNFGPTLTDALLAEPALALTLGGEVIAARAATFAAGPDDAPFLLRDSSGHLSIAVRNGSAAARLGAARGDVVVVHGLPARIGELAR